MAFEITDYAVFLLTLIISASIGIYYRFSGGKQTTTQEYLLGNRSQKVIPIAFSLVASFASSITILGTSAEAYSFGTQFFVIIFSYILSTALSICIYLPVYMKLGTISVYEYLERRFGMFTRCLASVAFIVQMILYMGIVHYAPALAMEAVTGISQVTSIIMIGLICIFYSTIGGIKAVIITDLFQALMMFAAVIAVIIVGIIHAGSFTELWKAADAGGRIQFLNFSLDPTQRHTWWTVIIGGTLTHMSLYAVNQTQVQRYVSMKNYRSAATALFVSCPILILFQICVCLSGLSMYYTYQHCDPVMQGRISTADQLMPLYVTDTFATIPGLTGIFAAGIFSASLSTVSAAVNSLAAVTLEDYINPLYNHYKGKEINEKRKSFMSKMVALAYGVICLIVALVARNYSSMLQAALTIFGVVGGPLLGLFTLGMVVPFVNQLGAITGFIAGLMFSFIIGFGGPKPVPVPLLSLVDGCDNLKNVSLQSTITNITKIISSTESGVSSSMDGYPYLFRISYLYYIVFGFTITITLGIITNLIVKSSSDVNPDLFTPCIARRLRKKNGTKLMHMTTIQNGNRSNVELDGTRKELDTL